MDLVLSVLLALLVILSTFFIRKLFLKQDEAPKNLPGPPVDETGTNLKELAAAGSMMKFIASLHQKYGPVAQFYLAKDSPLVSIDDLEIVKKTLKVGSRPRSIFTFLEPLLGTDNFQIYDGQRAKSFRQLVMPTLAYKSVEQKYDFLKAMAIDRITTLDPKGVKRFHAQNDLLGFGLDLSIRFLVGEISPGAMPSYSAFRNAYDTSLMYSQELSFGPLSPEKQKALEDSVQLIYKCFAGIVEQRKQELQEGSAVKNTFLDQILTQKDPNTQEFMEEKTVISLIIAFTLAGYHTTVVGISWTLYTLTQYPEVYAKVQKELDALFPDTRDLLVDTPTLEEINKMEYMAAVVNETMRVLPPGPFAARLLDEDVVVTASLKLPKGTGVFYPIFAIHKNPRYWENPEEFNPDRFSKENSKKLTKQAFMPFGIGARMCPGNDVSLVEGRLLLALILKRYKIKLAMKPEEVEPVERFVLWAKNDIVLDLEPRI